MKKLHEELATPPDTSIGAALDLVFGFSVRLAKGCAVMTGAAPPKRSQDHSPASLTGWGPVAAHATGVVASAGFALVWLGLSWWHPRLTYHFGPPLAAAAWPVLLRARLRRPAGSRQALAAVGGGFLVAIAAVGVAMAAHWLRGPTLIGTGSVPAEELVLAVVAAAWGWRVARRRRRAWFLPPEPSPGDSAPPPPPAEPSR